jgi:hypothetical protein
MKMDRTTIKWWVDRAGELEQDRNEWRAKAETLAAQGCRRDFSRPNPC